MLVQVAMAGPVKAFRGMVLDPVFHLRAGRELPRPPSWSHLDGALQAVAEEIPPWWRLPHLEADKALFLWFCVMVVGTVGLLAFAIWQRRREVPVSGRSTVLLVVALISLGILPAGAAAAGLGPPQLGHLRLLALRGRRRHRGGPALAAARRRPGRAGRRHRSRVRR